MYDLRSETDNQKLVDEIAEDWTTSSISPVQMAMCEFANKLTENPNKVNEKDIELCYELDSNTIALWSKTQWAKEFKKDGIGTLWSTIVKQSTI